MEQRYQHSSSDTLVVARALLVEVANGKEDLLWASLERYVDSDDLLAELLRAFAAAAEESDKAAEAARRVWPKVINHVLNLIEGGRRLKGYRFFGSQALAALMPNAASEVPYLRREVEGESIDWPELLSWRRQVERWLPIAAGSGASVDSLVRLLGSLSETDQAAVGLPWVEVLVKAGPDKVASGSWLLADWLHKVRVHAREPECLSSWQRIVDMLIVAGDTRVADLSD
jgi:AcrR family transcriptional regulator